MKMSVAQRFRLRALAVLLICVVLVFPADGALARTLALVVGVDAYGGSHRPLEGAVNDADDLTDALRRFGAERVVTLRDAEATRARIKAEWADMVAAARPGDVLVFTFAGHGAQAPELIPGSEVDGLDELLLLGGHRSSGPGAGEYILDDEIEGMFAAATARGAQVVAVMDTCHAGTLWRQTHGAAVRSSVLEQALLMEDDRLAALLAGPLQVDAITEGVTYFGAGQDNEQVPEIVIGGQRRGALSAAFAETLRASNGRLTFKEARSAVRASVLARSDWQTPNIVSALGPDDVVLLSPNWSPAAAPAPMVANQIDVSLSLAVESASPQDAAAAFERLPGVRRAVSAADADLVWNAACGALRTPENNLNGGVSLDTLPNHVAKWQLIEPVKRRIVGDSVNIEITPRRPFHRFGDVFSFRLETLPHPYLTIFGVASDGTINHLYPLAALPDGRPLRGGPDPVRVSLDRLSPWSIRATEPGGEDHLIVVATARQPVDLQKTLEAANGRREVLAVRRALLGTLDAMAHALGMSTLITGEPPRCD